MKERSFFKTSMTFMSIFIALLLLSACDNEQTVQHISIKPLENVVYTGEPVTFCILENIPQNVEVKWAFADVNWYHGDTTFYNTHEVTQTFSDPGIYHIALCLKTNCGFTKSSSAIVRVYNKGDKIIPQVILDTDARNEIDDQHFIAYALYSELDVLAITSIHNKEDFSEPENYGEIYHVLQKMWYSDYPKETPVVYHGATHMLERPESGIWLDTKPIVTEASNAILAAARGASPGNPVYVLPVGPGTNVASAILQAEKEGFDINGRIKVLGLIGGPKSVNENTYNGRNDPWSVYVIGESGIDFTLILEHPSGASLAFVKAEDANRYPENKIGKYLQTIMLNRLAGGHYTNDTKSLYDLSTISAVISEHLNLGWLTEVEDMNIADIDKIYTWQKTGEKSNVHIVWDIDEQAMKTDFFHTLNGNPRQLMK